MKTITDVTMALGKVQRTLNLARLALSGASLEGGLSAEDADDMSLTVSETACLVSEIQGFFDDREEIQKLNSGTP